MLKASTQPLRVPGAALVGPVPMPHNWMDFDEARAPIDDLSRFSLAPSNCPHVMPNWFGLKAGPGPILAERPDKKCRPQHRRQAWISAYRRLGQFGLILKQQGNSCP